MKLGLIYDVWQYAELWVMTKCWWLPCLLVDHPALDDVKAS